MLVYVDEPGMDNRDDYAYGWNQKGHRFHALKSGRRQGRVNMIAALCQRKLIAPFTVEGACNRAVFETWLETCLVPVLIPGRICDSGQCHFSQRQHIIFGTRHIFNHQISATHIQQAR